MSNKSVLLEAALEYSQRDWPVFPLKVKDKTPITSHGFKDASTDPQTIRSKWTQPYNIGMATGTASGIYVIDIDGPAGSETLEKLEGQHGELPTTVTVRTGKGFHYYFQMPPGVDLRNSAGNKLGEGIDTRGNGGYVVVPPSVHPEGHVYQWEVSLDDCELAELPQWVIKLVSAKATPPLQTAVASYTQNDKIRRYISGALNDACSKIAQAGEGTRNATLNTEGHSIGTFIGAGALNRMEAELRLSEAATAAGLEKGEIEKTLKSALDAGERKPRDLSSINQSGFKIESYHPVGQAPPDPQSTGSNGLLPLTDVGNAQRLVKAHGSDIRYCFNFKKWFIWSGTHWVPDGVGQIMQYAKKTARNIHQEASLTTDTTAQREISNFAFRSQSRIRLEAMIALTQDEPGIPLTPDLMDTDPWLFNCLSGTINLKTGILQPHCQQDLITKIARVAYDPAAQAPLWEAFLDRIFQGNSNIISFMQRVVGYSLTASTQEHCMFILYGNGANGKSTFLEVCRALLGDYAQQTPTETLTVKKGGGIPNDIARLQGARFVSAVESENNAEMAESLIKQLTGGDKLTARYLHAEFFEFYPLFKLFLGTNHKPKVKGTDNGIWRRLNLIPFDITIPKDEQDSKLLEKLKTELPGILNWAIAGCLEWQQSGLCTPEEVKAAINEYRQESDPVARFFGDACVLKEGACIPKGTLFERYTTWCSEEGEEPLGINKFGSKLKEKSFKESKTGNTRYWSGIKIREEWDTGTQGDTVSHIFSKKPPSCTENSKSSVPECPKALILKVANSPELVEGSQ